MFYNIKCIFFYCFLPIDVFCDPPHHHVHLGAVIGDVSCGHSLRPAVTQAPAYLRSRRAFQIASQIIPYPQLSA